MVDEQPFHKKARQPEKCGFFGFSIEPTRWQGLDARQNQVEFVHQRGRLPGVVATLALHALGGQPA